MNTKKPLVIMRGVDLIEEQIERTKSSDWRERKQALKEICPCKVEKEIDMFWKRVFEMAREGDPSPQVRYQILHTLCDGSPSHFEDEVLDVIQSVFWNDEDEKTRRAARRVVTSYRHTGKWNIM
eukprot:TRINITY_DN7548_c0_g1_i1.p1 TRINITY_DN7548_c0_g1~~TRINITY_DN7548_c0_g1_i1.p1  ORF type:complete len:124 (+),score=22.11 TRINITY_DN7548_c0_g1_i1:37-408(+)